MWKFIESEEFLWTPLLPDVIAGIGADRVWAHTRSISWSIETLVVADVDGGFCTATGTSLFLTRSPAFGG